MQCSDKEAEGSEAVWHPEQCRGDAGVGGPGYLHCHHRLPARGGTLLQTQEGQSISIIIHLKEWMLLVTWHIGRGWDGGGKEATDPSQLGYIGASRRTHNHPSETLN